MRKKSGLANDGGARSVLSWSTPISSASNAATGPKRGCCSQTEMRTVTTGRIVFLIFLCAVAVALGHAAHALVSSTEDRLSHEQFESIADRALSTSATIALRMRLGLVTMQSIFEQNFPDAQTWPFVNFKGFEIVSNNVINATSSESTSPSLSIGFLPLVTPEQLEDFNEFGSSLYPDAPFDRVTGLDQAFSRYNETDGETYWGSPYRILAPFLYHSRGPILHMANLHSIKTRGEIIDAMIACSEERARDPAIECSVLTDMVDLSNRNPVEEPSAIAYLPIYPAHNRTVMTGLLTATVKWLDVLYNVFPTEVSGIDCVFETETTAFTYEINNGIASLKGEGDLHDFKFHEDGRKTFMNDPGLYGVSALYSLTIYPNEEFFEVYTTNNPMIATIGSVCIIIFTSFLFILYDSFVRKEFNSKKSLAQAKRHFVRFISHEVRTPLNAVSMGLQLLLDEIERLAKSSNRGTLQSSKSVFETEEHNAQLQDKLKDWAGVTQDILTSTESAVTVLSDMLNYDKVESRTLSLELSEINIWTLIKQTCNEFRPQTEMARIKYIVDFGRLANTESKADSISKLPKDIADLVVVGDKARLAQSLRNLVSNGIKFTPEGGNLTVQVSRKKLIEEEVEDRIVLHNGDTVPFMRDSLLEVTVTDSGAGLSQEQLSRLFSEGVQFNVNMLQSGKGSGLGLFISKGMIEQHGGLLTAESEGIGQGTTFRMILPLYRVKEKPQTNNSEGPSATENVSDEGIDDVFTPLNVLIVDDSAMNRKLLARLLKNRGHTCDEAENGLVAVQRVAEHMKQNNEWYDSILIDYDMPVMDGPTAMKQIRELGCGSFTIGITGNLFSEQIAHFMDSGANKVLPKPLNMRLLFDTWSEDGMLGYARKVEAISK